MRARSVFTATTISPSPPLRQRPSRYTIRARRNLPDKEFRYLRTVIVTAAIHWGFGSTLLPALRREAPLPYPSGFGRGSVCIPRLRSFAQTCVFTKQSLGPLYCDLIPLHPRGTSRDKTPLLPKLRGQVAEFLNGGSLERLSLFDQPTCVGLRYGHERHFTPGFSWQLSLHQFTLTVVAAPRRPSPRLAAELQA